MSSLVAMEKADEEARDGKIFVFFLEGRSIPMPVNHQLSKTASQWKIDSREFVNNYDSKWIIKPHDNSHHPGVNLSTDELYELIFLQPGKPTEAGKQHMFELMKAELAEFREKPHESTFPDDTHDKCQKTLGQVLEFLESRYNTVYTQLGRNMNAKRGKTLKSRFKIGKKRCPPGCMKRKASRKVSRKRRSTKHKASRKRKSAKRKSRKSKKKTVKELRADCKAKGLVYDLKSKKCRPSKLQSAKRKVSRKRRSAKRKVSRKRQSTKRKVSRKRRSAKRKVSRKKVIGGKMRTIHKSKNPIPYEEDWAKGFVTHVGPGGGGGRNNYTGAKKVPTRRILDARKKLIDKVYEIHYQLLAIDSYFVYDLISGKILSPEEWRYPPQFMDRDELKDYVHMATKFLKKERKKYKHKKSHKFSVGKKRVGKKRVGKKRVGKRARDKSRRHKKDKSRRHKKDKSGRHKKDKSGRHKKKLKFSAGKRTKRKYKKRTKRKYKKRTKQNSRRNRKAPKLKRYGTLTSQEYRNYKFDKSKILRHLNFVVSPTKTDREVLAQVDISRLVKFMGEDDYSLAHTKIYPKYSTDLLAWLLDGVHFSSHLPGDKIIAYHRNPTSYLKYLLETPRSKVITPKLEYTSGIFNIIDGRHRLGFYHFFDIDGLVLVNKEGRRKIKNLGGRKFTSLERLPGGNKVRSNIKELPKDVSKIINSRIMDIAKEAVKSHKDPLKFIPPQIKGRGELTQYKKAVKYLQKKHKFSAGNKIPATHEADKNLSKAAKAWRKASMDCFAENGKATMKIKRLTKKLRKCSRNLTLSRELLKANEKKTHKFRNGDGEKKPVFNDSKSKELMREYMKAMTNIKKKPVVLYAGTKGWMHHPRGFGTPSDR
jgi:hypothetical protein